MPEPAAIAEPVSSPPNCRRAIYAAACNFVNPNRLMLVSESISSGWADLLKIEQLHYFADTIEAPHSEQNFALGTSGFSPQ